MWILLPGIVYVLLQSCSARQSGCPPASQVEPCVCTNSGITYLKCQNIDDTDTLSNVFIKSSNYRYTEVHIEQSVLQFLPSDMFQGVQIKELHLKNVTLVELFDEEPNNLDMLDVLHIERTNVFRGMNWELLKPMKNLRVLTVYFDSIPTLELDFSESVNKNLQQLTFYGTETAEISQGALENFEKLEKVAFEACELTELKRSMFPHPFNVKVLHFNDNKLTTIPKNMFTGMPNLQTLGLRKNQISVLPATAFVGSLEKLEYLFLDNNPLRCDCKILWLIKHKPLGLTGTCYNLQDQNLKDIEVTDIPCIEPLF
ncbi:hypothetical protein JTE90_011085 [Oedothorax gibbosus]|uniref:Uncharacterized protein n=1 Tax=Oedothorax gibbosus TaxID=931172 RepID=A0AAV6UKZ9_9ARAC|nr:hypothetical protein JTE90_011085 [Oedothorax gibbosus]